MRVLHAFIFCLLFFSAAAQTYQEETRILANLQQCDWLDRTGMRDSSLQMLCTTFKQAWQLGKAEPIAQTWLARIRHFSRYQLRDSLEKNLDPLIEFARKNGLTSIQAEALFFKAWHWLETQRYRQSLEFCEQAIDLTKDLNDTRLNGLGLLCKGTVLRTTQNDSKVPLPYFYRALETLQKTADTANVIRSAMLISSGEDNENVQKEMLGLATALSNAYPNEITRMGLLNFKSRLLPSNEALVLLEEASSIAKKLRIPNMIQHLYLQMSGRYLDLKEYDKAIAYMDLANEAFPKNLPDDGALHYYEIYKAKGDFKKAVEYNERFRQYEDERKQTDMRSFVTEWETKMNVRETQWQLQQEQKEASSQRTRSLLLALVLLLALAAGGVSLRAYFRQRKARAVLTVQHETISRQAEELKSLEQLKSRFFANVSHELRTPLTLMLGPLSNLLKQTYLKERDQSLLSVMQRNGKQLLNLVNEILDLSKLETGRLELKEAPVNWFAALEASAAQFSSFSNAGAVKWTFGFRSDRTLVVLLDLGKFEKIIHNFLSNAMKFVPAGGEVVLLAEDTANELCVTVRDTGPGIHPNDLPYIFDRFYQSKLPDAPVQGGTGIGLSLCKELAELMGGTVWAESEYGKGSAFFFRFPKKVAPENAMAATIDPTVVAVTPTVSSQIVLPDATPSVVVETIKKATVLIVEDNADLREYLRVVLSDYQLIEAENGQVAQEILQKVSAEGGSGKPDLIISDLMMPVMDGFLFLEWVKSRDEYRHVPFIMLTARADVRVKLRALRVGVDDYILKPFVEEELLARVQNLLEHYRTRVNLHSFIETEVPDNQAAPALPVLSEANAKWLEEVEKLMRKKLNDHAFNLDWVAAEIHLSERQLRRKIQQFTGLSPNQYLQEMRMQTAKDLLVAGKYTTVKEVSFAVGYRDTGYFSGLFAERFGANPSQYSR